MTLSVVQDSPFFAGNLGNTGGYYAPRIFFECVIPFFILYRTGRSSCILGDVNVEQVYLGKIKCEVTGKFLLLSTIAFVGGKTWRH